MNGFCCTVMLSTLRKHFSEWNEFHDCFLGSQMLFGRGDALVHKCILSMSSYILYGGAEQRLVRNCIRTWIHRRLHSPVVFCYYFKCFPIHFKFKSWYLFFLFINTAILQKYFSLVDINCRFLYSQSGNHKYAARIMTADLSVESAEAITSQHLTWSGTLKF